MRVQSADGFIADWEAKGVERDVSLFMLPDEPLNVDDYVMVHIGYAIPKISYQDAQTVWEFMTRRWQGSIDMHGLAICQSLTDQVERIALERHAGCVCSIVIGMCPLSGVETQLLKHAYSIASVGTVAELIVK